MPSYSTAFLLLCCYIPAYTNYSLHPTDKHFVFAEGFCMFFFLFTLSTLTHEKIYWCKNKSEGENLLTVSLKLFSVI